VIVDPFFAFGHSTLIRCAFPPPTETILAGFLDFGGTLQIYAI